MENKELTKKIRITVILCGICAVLMLICVILNIVKSRDIVFIIMYAIATVCWVISFVFNLKSYKEIKNNSDKSGE